jgi:chemotaxis protein MotB
MRIRPLLLISGFVVMVLAACMPMPLYNETQTDLEQCRNKKDEALQELANLNAEHKQAAVRHHMIEQKLSVSEANRSRLEADLKRLKTQNAYLKKINQQQQANVNTLKLELEKRKSVIQLQGKVIQLLDDTKKTIETSLKDQIAAQEIEVVEVDDKLKVIFVDKILFDSGSVEINPRGKELLMLMAGSLKDSKDQNVVVEGHTDNVPLSAALRKLFPSNWELSTARAAAVARFFQEEGGIPAEKLSARGYSYYRPVASNETADGRHQNRRIEIILSPSKND